ncbi:MAG TPA: ROK family protein [Terriglobales bacterium]|nr:ROK family protein [Terriglobales bacterium]
MSYSIGVDLGGTNLRIAAVNEQGSLLEKVTLATRLSLGRDRVLDDMCQAIRALAAKYRGQGTLQGIGIGVPGIIDMRTGMLRESPNLPGWADYPVRGEIEKRLGARVVLENDANCAALGEKWLGAGRDVDDLAMLTLGTGVGGGIVLGGRIWHGMTGMAGEFGHMTIGPDGLPCKCGSRGCLEVYASATAVVRMAREQIELGMAPGLARVAASGAEFTAETVYRLAAQGDDAAQHIFGQVGSALGIALATIVNGLNLSMYVIGGGLSGAWDAFSPTMFREVRDRSMVYAATAPESSDDIQPDGKTVITRARLGSDAGLFGAARLATVSGV